jgi:hypothetical protein
MNVKRALPLILAIIFGMGALIGLLFAPTLAELLLGWGAFLAAVALLLGVLNLMAVHLRRVIGGNLYSGVLLFSMVAVFGLALTDFVGVTEDGVNGIFRLIQIPLESALAALLAFFLLFAGVRLLGRQRSWWSLLFIVTTILVLLSRTPLPETIAEAFGWVGDQISLIFVGAGMRGILIGVAMGTILVGIRFLIGSERPYDK